MSFLPLTTTFTPPSSCLGTNNIWNIIYSPSFDYFVQGPPSTYRSDCLPSGYKVPSSGDSDFTFYSPGICPSGYTSACPSTKTFGPSTVTVQICCPPGFVFPLRLVV